MKAIYVVFSDGAESMAYLDQERGVWGSFWFIKWKVELKPNLDFEANLTWPNPNLDPKNQARLP